MLIICGLCARALIKKSTHAAFWTGWRFEKKKRKKKKRAALETLLHVVEKRCGVFGPGGLIKQLVAPAIKATAPSLSQAGFFFQRRRYDLFKRRVCKYTETARDERRGGRWSQREIRHLQALNVFYTEREGCDSGLERIRGSCKHLTGFTTPLPVD